MLGNSPITWRQCPDMDKAVDCEVKQHFKQSKSTCQCVGNENYFNMQSLAFYDSFKSI